MNEIINKFREYMKKNKGSTYPIEKHILSQKNVDEYTKENYLKMLFVIMRYDGQGTEEQALFIKRLISGIGGESTFEEYLRKSMEVDIKFFEDVLKQIKDNDLKYAFVVDSLLITYIAPTVTEEQVNFVAELAEMVGIEKEELKFISGIVKTILEQDTEGYLKICDEISIDEEKRNILISVYSYVKEFVGGAKKFIGEDDSCYIVFPKIMDIIKFGRCNWRVLDVKEDKMFVISKDAVGCMAWGGGKECAYKASDIRKWLNVEFINSSFDISEQKRIINTDLKDENVVDKVFLLSADEFFCYISDFLRDDMKDSLLICPALFWGNEDTSGPGVVREKSICDDVSRSDRKPIYPAMWVQL